MSESKEIATITPDEKSVSAFSSGGAFETAQRIAKALASSDLVPSQFKGNVANCLVALEIAHRTGSSALAVMQNLYIVHGRPSWSAQYTIAALNSCGRFEPLRFKMEGEGDKRSCTAWTLDKSGEKLEGPTVSIAMAKAEGWFQKSGSKWQTMPELMLRYRAAAFFGRLYAPDVLFGMSTEDEARDVSTSVAVENPTAELNKKIRAKKSAKPEIVDSVESSSEESV